MKFICAECGCEYPLDGLDYQCPCGGLFQLSKAPGETVGAGVSLGEVPTPALRRKLGHTEVYLKLDYLQPTGSFKDRGAFVLINKLRELGIREVVEDSSGNAGAAIAGYCAAAGIRTRHNQYSSFHQILRARSRYSRRGGVMNGA